jgi:phage-related holin
VEVVKFLFDGWHFLGVCVILWIILDGLADIAKAWRKEDE